ncbi:hypothetical protein EII22_09040 [Coriobacteriales bacterium OH1046]|nr:hypothetical protein EII22_09040 [Coriobacteriales bacterium OH1046]
MEEMTEIAALKVRMDTVEHRVGEHGKEIDALSRDSTRMDVILARIDQTVGKIDGKLDSISAKPAQRWESLTAQVIAIIVAALLAVALYQMGLKP